MKCKQSVEYLGYTVDAQGLHISPEKVQGIREAPQPKNHHSLVNNHNNIIPKANGQMIVKQHFKQ